MSAPPPRWSKPNYFYPQQQGDWGFRMIYAARLSDHFAKTLTTVLLERYPAQSDLANVRVILPTRRACRTVKEAFLQHAQTRPMLLPRLIPLYDFEDLSADLPPACSAVERTLLLTHLCRAKPHVASLPAALKIALGLGALLDEFYQFEVSPDALDTLVQEASFAEHWNQTVAFLDIIRVWWPRILQERGQIDAMDRTVRQIDALNKKFQHVKPEHPIVLAGFDGGIKAVNRLINTLNKFDNTLILFDYFDFNISKGLFDTADETHPLYKKIRLMKDGGISLQAVHPITNETNTARENWLYRAFADRTETGEPVTKAAFHNVHRLTCATAAEEAAACALILRQILETPGKTAALVTTDRTLSRRVISEMKRWGIDLDDSAGQPLLHTPVGVFLALVADAAVPDTGTRPLNALFKHPFAAAWATHLNLSAAEVDARRHDTPLTLALPPFFKQLQQAAADGTLRPLNDWLTLHLNAAAELASAPETPNTSPTTKDATNAPTSLTETGQARLWAGDAGEAALSFLTQVQGAASVIHPMDFTDYRGLINLFFMNESVRPAYGTHPRLSILGPIEARLFHPDLCIIGGLNEGIFPETPDSGPWLNRPMRRALGLPVPETKTAALAADFMHCCAAPEVWLTRSAKSGGAPTIPSRFLSRLDAAAEQSGEQFLTDTLPFLAALDRPKVFSSPERPAPCPPVNKRPRTLAATRIELWMRNPYAIYARFILGLFPLPELEEPRPRQVFGSLVHAVLEDFFKTAPDTTNTAVLTAQGEKALAHSTLTPAERAFFAPQWAKIAAFVTKNQAVRAPFTRSTTVEATGTLTLNRPGGAFTLTARADRIDLMQDGTVELIDYKTGSVPSLAEIAAGYAPQLPLEGLILSAGGFSVSSGSKAPPVLTHWQLSGRDTGGRVAGALGRKATESDALTLLEHTRAGLERLIDVFDRPETPYEATPVPGKAPRYDDYRHLARTQEWMNDDSQEDDPA